MSNEKPNNMDGTGRDTTSSESSDNSLTPEFVGLLTAHQSKIYAYLVSLVGNCNDADDIMQETAAVMWNKYSTFNKGSNFLSWALVIAYYKVKEFRRKNYESRKFQLDDEVIEKLAAQAPMSLDDSNLYLEKLRECLRKLNSEDYMLIKYRYSMAYKMQQLASQCNRSIRSLYYKLAKIQDVLIRCIEFSILHE